MSASRAFVKDRNAVLRALDETAFDKFYRKWEIARPREWIGNARLIMMHKARLHIVDFTQEEKSLSRRWLAEHGYDESIGDDRPCPECGGYDVSATSCKTCGTGMVQ